MTITLTVLETPVTLEFLGEVLYSQQIRFQDAFQAHPEDFIITEVKPKKLTTAILKQIHAFPLKRPGLIIVSRKPVGQNLHPDLLPYVSAVVNPNQPEELVATIMAHVMARHLAEAWPNRAREAMISGQPMSAYDHAKYLAMQFEAYLDYTTMVALDYGDGPAAYHHTRSWADYEDLFPEPGSISLKNLRGDFMWANDTKTGSHQITSFREGAEETVAFPLVDTFRLIINVAFDALDGGHQLALPYYPKPMQQILAPVLSEAATRIQFQQVNYDMGRLEQFASDTSFFQAKLDSFRRSPNPDQLRYYNNLLDRRTEHVMKIVTDGPKGIAVKTPLTKKQGLDVPALWENLGTGQRLNYREAGPRLSSHPIYAGVTLEILRLFAKLSEDEPECHLRVTNMDMPKHIITYFTAEETYLGHAESQQLLDGLSLFDPHSRLFEARTVVRLWGGDLQIQTDPPEPGVTVILSAPVVIFNYGTKNWGVI